MQTHAPLAGHPTPPQRRRLKLATRRVLPWERPAAPIPSVAVEVPASERERQRRGELARQVSQLPAELVQQLLLEEVAEAPAQIRLAVLVRQLDETATPKRGALLAQTLRRLGPALLTPLDARAWLANGMVDDVHLEALLARLGVRPEAWKAPAMLALVDARGPAARLCEGHQGGAVRRLQQRLCDLGYLSEDVLAQHPGVFEAQTGGALRAFQADHGLPATGDLGPRSQRALDAAVTPR